MHKFYELKDALCKKLEEYNDEIVSKGKIDSSYIDMVDKLAHAIKNLDKVMEKDDDYSYNSYNYENARPMNNVAYRRGNNSMANRAYMDGYSAASEDTVGDLRNLINNISDDKTRMEIMRIIRKIEQM